VKMCPLGPNGQIIKPKPKPKGKKGKKSKKEKDPALDFILTDADKKKKVASGKPAAAPAPATAKPKSKPSGKPLDKKAKFAQRHEEKMENELTTRGQIVSNIGATDPYHVLSRILQK
jgi:hypothetical protein